MHCDNIGQAQEVAIKRECSNKLLDHYGHLLYLHGWLDIAQNQNSQIIGYYCLQGGHDDDEMGIARCSEMSVKPIKCVKSISKLI